MLLQAGRDTLSMKCVQHQGMPVIWRFNFTEVTQQDGYTLGYGTGSHNSVFSTLKKKNIGLKDAGTYACERYDNQLATSYKLVIVVACKFSGQCL